MVSKVSSGTTSTPAREPARHRRPAGWGCAPRAAVPQSWQKLVSIGLVAPQPAQTELITAGLGSRDRAAPQCWQKVPDSVFVPPQRGQLSMSRSQLSPNRGESQQSLWSLDLGGAFAGMGSFGGHGGRALRDVGLQPEATSGNRRCGPSRALHAATAAEPDAPDLLLAADPENQVVVLKSAPRMTRLGPPRAAHFLLPERRSLAVAALCAVVAAGCSPMVDRAPFPYRADTLSPGDLLGPFEGLVVDAETDRPIAGAVVAGSWAFERGVGLVGPAGANELVTETGADGRYRLPALSKLPDGASMRVRRFTLIVYQKGYVGWRSDRRFPSGEPRQDFSQRGNRVRLEKWRDGLVHAQHLVFLGGGAAIKAAAQPEVQAAVFELEGRAPSPEGKRRPGRRRKGGPARCDPVAGRGRVARGHRLRGRVRDRPADRSAAHRVLRHPPLQGARARPRSTTSVCGSGGWVKPAPRPSTASCWGSCPGPPWSTRLGDASLRARQGDLLGLAFLARSRGIVVALTCGVGQCSEAAVLTRIAKLVEGHLGDLLPLPPKPAAPAAPPPPPAEPPAPATGSGAGHASRGDAMTNTKPRASAPRSATAAHAIRISMPAGGHRRRRAGLWRAARMPGIPPPRRPG